MISTVIRIVTPLFLIYNFIGHLYIQCLYRINRQKIRDLFGIDIDCNILLTPTKDLINDKYIGKIKVILTREELCKTPVLVMYGPSF